MNSEFWIKFFQHLNLSLYAFSISCVISLIVISISVYNKVFKSILLNIISFIQTIPSIAILGLLLPVLGIGNNLALVAIVSYSIFPIVSSTLGSLNSIDGEYNTIIQSLSISKMNALWNISIPLIFSSCISGIKLSLIYALGTTTLSSFVGAGGLGDFIFQGISANNMNLTLKGSIPIALLAVLFGIIFDFLISLNNKRKLSSKNFFKFILSPLIIVMFSINTIIMPIVANSKSNKVVIGYKNFPEQKLLANLTKSLIQRNSKIKVETKALGDTGINILNGLKNKTIDGAVEYSGTVFLSVFNYKLPKNYKNINLDEYMFKNIKKSYNKNDLKMFEPIGFENNYSIVVNKNKNINKISDLKSIQNNCVFGMTNEFYIKEDGYKNFIKTYKLDFKDHKTFDPAIMYQALKNKKIDVGLAYSTSPEIKQFNLKILKDDKKFFPTYSAFEVFSKATLKKFPELNKIIRKTKNLISTKKMQELNYKYVSNPSKMNQLINDFLNENKL